MYLRSLELQGFKSFPDKIKLHFDKGLTAVVGPNGSGKSNIGDAVRWVLGEQSTKTLRGNKMEDVIFSGTKTRKAMGFAAVTLEISNEAGELGEAYGAVVSVTRKLYRSGDSEYRINGKNVRLKDVTELFMDTGMGRDGYAIIGQGRIAEIVSAKSADRRDIFEEAAGVSKFRYKKQEAQRKLDAAQENLVRLQDIVSELESRVEPLRKQAEKAKQYVELAGKQKQLEVSLWVRRLGALREKLTGLSDGLLQAQAEYQNAEREIQRTDAQVQDGYRRMQESTLKMEEIRQQMQQAEEETTQLKSAVAVCENDILHSRQMQESLRQQKQETAQQSRSMESRMESLSEQVVQLRQKREAIQVESEQTEQNWNALKQQAARRGQEYEQANQVLQNLLVRQSELRVLQQTAAGQQEELKAQLAEQGMRQSALRQACTEQNAAYDAAREQAQQAQEQFQQVQNQRDGFQKRYAHAVQALEAGKKQQEQAAFALREKRQRQRLLQDMERNMEGFGGSVKAVLRADGGKPRGVFGTVAQLITTDQKYGVALETALGGAMQNLIVENENAAKQWIRFLQQKHAGRATFLPLTSVRGKTLYETGLEQHEGFVDLACNLVRYEERFSGVVQFLLGRIVVAEDLDTATALEQEQSRLAERRSQLKIGMMELEKDMDTLAKEMQQQSDQQDSMAEKLVQIDKDIAVQEDLIRQKQTEITENQARLEQMQNSRTDGQAEIRHWQQVHDAQEQQIRELQSGLQETNAVRERFSGEISRLEERKISVQNDYDGVIRQLLEQYELSLSEAQAQAQPLEDLQTAQRELQSLKAQIRGLGTVNVAAIEEYAEVSKRYQFLSEQMQDAETAKRELEDLITSLTEEMQRIFSESFSVIDRNFQEIFKDLFGGGEARLELTDPEHVLESGIEIKVAPPGKVIKNLISLSGGEQSFVAIAIYFAILRLRPSPFCILDEIDAALDEGNVRRYAQYLQNFTDTTQFILVTHRRSAMEEASVLYGVTMQEDGISRLLRMEQEELEKTE